jgi:hypothetical protein
VAAFDNVILFPATRYVSVASVPFAYFTDYQNRPPIGRPTDNTNPQIE